MTSLPVKEIGSIITRTASSGTGMTTQSAGSVSFESVWSNQTEKHSQTENITEDRQAVRKEDDTVVRDSLKSKDARKSVVKQSETTQEPQADDLRNMNPEEWEKAMEVLGAAAVEMINQVATAFDMTVEEVQGLMSDLGLEQLDVLQQEGLSELILAAGGAENATDLLTNEELYQQFQGLMEQLGGVLEESGETLQLDAEALVEMALENTDEAENLNISVEVIADDEVVVEDEPDNVPSEDVPEDTVQEQTTQVHNVETEKLTDNQTENQTGKQMQEQGGEHVKAETQVAENKGQSENLLVQNLKNENFEPQLQHLSETVSAWDSDTMDIMKQIMDYMKIQVKPDMSNLEMQLHPESLGTLQIHVASKGGNITAQFVTQNDAVKAALESQMIQLKENFAQQGVKVDAIEVTVQAHQFEQNLEQGRGRQQEEPGRRTRTRRIQLDGMLSMDDLVGMEEEEQLAAEMMAANGNTVDYTA